MIKYITKISKKITWKHWLLFLMLSQTIYWIMRTLNIPFIERETGGLKIFDMMPFGYSYDYTLQFLSQLSTKGYKLYKYVQLPMDVLFPVFNCIMGICTFVLLIRVYRRMKCISSEIEYPTTFILILSLPIISLLLDYMENIMILIMLDSQFTSLKSLTFIANIFTIGKSMSTMLFYSISIIACVIIGAQWMKNIIRSANDSGKL